MPYDLFLDVDGVVADFTAGYIAVHNTPNPFDDPKNRGDKCWNIYREYGITDSEFWAPMGRDFWANLPKTKDADEIADTCLRYFGKDHVCFLTSPCETDGCIDGKRDWIRKHYPDIPVLFAPSTNGRAPKHFCAGRGKILVDDHTPNVKKWADNGGQSILVPRPWNEDWLLEESDNYLEGLKSALALIVSVLATQDLEVYVNG